MFGLKTVDLTKRWNKSNLILQNDDKLRNATIFLT